jgi:hypothetical protein
MDTGLNGTRIEQLGCSDHRFGLAEAHPYARWANRFIGVGFIDAIEKPGTAATTSDGTAQFG